MKTLHAYLTREVLIAMSMTVTVFTGVLLLANVMKEIMDLLVKHQISLGIVIEGIALLIPWVLVYSLPIGMLTATLLVFGRFSAEQELTAARANGISLLSLAAPILLLSVAMSALCGWMNTDIAPRARFAYLQLLSKAALADPNAFLAEGRYIKEIPNYTIFVKKKRQDDLIDVLMDKTDESQAVVQRIHADRGRLIIEPGGQKAHFVLTDVNMINREGTNWYPVSMVESVTDSFDLKTAQSGKAEPKLSEMTVSQLFDKTRELERTGHDATPARFNWHKQISFSFACIGFTMVGIPLGIRTHRKETSIGVALSLILMLIYYIFIIIGQALQTKAQYYPYLILWVPNFLFQMLGGFLLWRANRR